ncbi:hypothetical protein LLG10_02395 [bacterium]|nr:hypothetical protein [bacterium]
MSQFTLHHLITTPPFLFKKYEDIELSKGEQLIEQGWEMNTRTSLEYLLRSLYEETTLIHHRLYYLIHYAKTQDEKIRCLAANLDDLELLMKQDKKNKKLYSLLIAFQSLFLAEVFWEEEFTRHNAEELWRCTYNEENDFTDIAGLPAVVMNRIPLFKKTKKAFTERLFSLPDDSALFTYAKALSLYSKDSQSKKAKEMLALSLQLNPNVPEFILTKKRIPKNPVDEIEPGQISEAKYIGYLSGESWWSVKGAIDFLKLASG